MKKQLTVSFLSALFTFSAYAEDGVASYALCTACHGPDGQGVKLGADMLMAPTLTNSKLITGDPEILARIILKGIKKEDSKYAGVMAPLEAVYDDAKLASVINYVRSSFENKATADVTPEQAKEWREKYTDQKESSSRADLEAMIKE